MNTTHIEYFLILCEELNFTRAAKKCGVTQPTISLAVRGLEAELGGLLFNRQHVQLTSMGQAVRPHLREMLLNLGQARKVALRESRK